MEHQRRWVKVTDFIRRHRCAAALSLISGAIVVIGVAFGESVIRPSPTDDIWSSMARWDGEHYKSIAVEGYRYVPDRASTVAFFPAYPLSARMLMALGSPPSAALLVVSHTCCAVATILFLAYLRVRNAATPRALQRAT